MIRENERYVALHEPVNMSHLPKLKLAVVTCMDCRLVNFLEETLNINRGDVLEIRTAGATIPKPVRGGMNSVVTSLIVGVHRLGVREIFVIAHTECGMMSINPADLFTSMQEMGIDTLALIQQYGSAMAVMEALGVFRDLHSNVQDVVISIRENPWLCKIPTHGLVINIKTGKLTVVDRDTRLGLISSN